MPITDELEQSDDAAIAAGILSGSLMRTKVKVLKVVFQGKPIIIVEVDDDALKSPYRVTLALTSVVRIERTKPPEGTP